MHIPTFLAVVFVLVEGESVVTCALVTSDSILADMLAAAVIHGALVFVWKQQTLIYCQYKHKCIPS